MCPSKVGLPGVQYLTGLSGILALCPTGIKMIVIPDNACVNSSIFCDTDTAGVRYFGDSHLATLF